jgi:hypothetical protein
MLRKTWQPNLLKPYQCSAAAFFLEDVVVTAFTGAAPRLVEPEAVAIAAGGVGTQAYHAGAVRAALLGIVDQVRYFLTDQAYGGGWQADTALPRSPSWL